MRTLPGASWRDAYLTVAEHLVRQASQARLVLTGTSACVDAVFHRRRTPRPPGRGLSE